MRRTVNRVSRLIRRRGGGARPVGGATDRVLPPFTLHNLVATPRLSDAPITRDRTLPAAEIDRSVYVHVHAQTESAPSAKVPGVTADEAGSALWISGRSQNTDSYISPGGREGDLRFGLHAGETFTTSVDVLLERRLTGPATAHSRCIVIGTARGSSVEWASAKSDPAPNEAGRYRISVTYSLPHDATAVFVRLIAGTVLGGGVVGWDRLSITRTASPTAYFDELTPDDRFFTYSVVPADGRSVAARAVRPVASVVASDATLDDFVAAVLELRHVLTPEECSHVAREWIETARECHGPSAELAVRELLAIPNALWKSKRLITAANDLECLTLWDALAGEALLARSWRVALDAATRSYAAAPSAARAYALAHAMEKSGREPESRQLVLRTVSDDPQPGFDIVAAATQDAKVLRPRLECADFLRAHLPEIRERADAFGRDHRIASGREGHVFSWWAQGFDSAPPIVALCARRCDEVFPNAHHLDEGTLPYWVSLPASTKAATTALRAHFSDIVRVDLLARYDGVWLDATCYPNPALSARCAELDASAGTKLLVFSYGGARISSWMICARDSRIVVMLRQALILWWERLGYLNDYFLFHHLFEFLVYLDPECAEEWEHATKLDARTAHAFQREMFDIASPDRGRELIHAAEAQKLKYQYKSDQVRIDSLVARLVRGEISI